jgi:rare lipoprotein A
VRTVDRVDGNAAESVNPNRAFYTCLRIICFFITGIYLVSCAGYQRRSEPGYAVASWYGPEFQGKPTSSGAIFDMYAFTCAHKEYPFGTELKVTNLSNNKNTRCVVNDRGPFVEGRDLDLSYAAAKAIDLVGPGTCRVRVEYLGRDTSYIKEVRYLSYNGPFTVQVGSFRDISNALRLKKGLDLEYHDVYVTEADINGTKFYRVRIGRFDVREKGYDFAKILAHEGYNVFIASYVDSGKNIEEGHTE